MSTLQTSLYLVAITLCVFSTALTTRKLAEKPLRFFTWFLVIQAGSFLCELWIAHPSTPYKGVALGLLMASGLLLAPCLWLAVQEGVTGNRPDLSTAPRGHWWAVGIGAACTLPLVLNANAGTTFVNPEQPATWLHARFIHATMLICMGIFIVQVPWYLARSRRLLLARLDGRSRHWAEWPLAIVFTTWILAIVRTLDCAFIKWPPMFSLLVAFVSVGVTVAALYLLLREFSPPAKPAPESYAKSKLGVAIRLRIRRKLEAVMSRQDVYTRNDLSLGALAELLNESPHYVSQVISQEFSSSFHELVNRARIEHVKRRLRETPGANVLAIAMDAGFNSKSAFNNAFRKVTGTTPGNFRQIN